MCMLDKGIVVIGRVVLIKLYLQVNTRFYISEHL